MIQDGLPELSTLFVMVDSGPRDVRQHAFRLFHDGELCQPHGIDVMRTGKLCRASNGCRFICVFAYDKENRQFVVPKILG